jgi:hypothetical protein
VTADRFRPGSSGVFKVLVDSARRVKRAVTGGDELTPEVEELGTKIGQAFVALRIADVHELGTPGFQVRSPRDRFIVSWTEAIRERGPLTGFEVSSAGDIELAFIPGLEDVPQSAFVAFVEIVFSTPQTPLDDERAFAIGAIVLDDAGTLALGALHAR